MHGGFGVTDDFQTLLLQTRALRMSRSEMPHGISAGACHTRKHRSAAASGNIGS
jgi:hypothetical protein